MAGEWRPILNVWVPSRKSLAIIVQFERKNFKLLHYVISFEVLKRSYCKVRFAFYIINILLNIISP